MASAKPKEKITLPREDAIEGLGTKYPSTAPVPIEEAAKAQEKADAKADAIAKKAGTPVRTSGKSPDKLKQAASKADVKALTERVAILERAIVENTTITLSEFARP